VTGTGKEWWYHWKADELRRSNPSALVPTLIPVNPETGVADESKVGAITYTISCSMESLFLCADFCINLDNILRLIAIVISWVTLSDFFRLCFLVTFGWIQSNLWNNNLCLVVVTTVWIGTGMYLLECI
jgi:hypothetical protein